MLHNNASWLPPHQQQQQQQAHPPHLQQQQQHGQQQPPHPVQQPQLPHQQQQPQLYASQMFQDQQQQQQPATTNYWQPEEQQQHAQQSLNYNNYFAGQQQQQQQPQQQLYYPTHHQPALGEAVLDSFDNNNTGGTGVGGSGGARNDGWGDWGDWNDNNNTSIVSSSNANESVMEPPQEQLLEDSFNVQSSTGSWQAFANNNVEQTPPPPLQQQQPPPPLQQQQQAPPPLLQQQQQQPPPLLQQQQQQPPPPLLQQQQQQQPPPSLLQQQQAPPPSLLQQQPLSPPELGQEPELDAIVPPQAFQNQPAAAVGPLGAGGPPPPALAPPVALPPSVAPAALPPSMPPAAGNPFKRSTGLSKRVNILATAPEGGAASSPMAPVAPIAPVAPLAPAPAEQLFGLPAEVQGGEPFSILAALPVAASIPALAPAAVNPSAAAPVTSLYAPPVQLEQPDNQEVLSAPNDERAQYLQTSHLSEQLGGEGETDQDAGLLPPPGLSRLVLGQPELDFQQQRRLVTGGTESQSPLLNVAQAAALHMEERQADGEDTSDGEQQVRNLQTPPRRVVTGVETSVAPITPLAVREQREVVLDGENLDDREAVSPPPSVDLLPPSSSSVHHIMPADEPEQLHHNQPQTPVAISQQQQQSQQTSLQQQQQQQPQLEKRSAAGRRGNGAASLDLESEDESDEFLASERERDREHARERRDPIDERRERRGRGSHYTYDGETEDSVRGATHNETKSLRDTHHRRSNHESSRSNRRHPEPEVERERNRDRDRERERERDRNWHRRPQKYFSGGEDQDRSYDHSRRGYNNSNYDGESDNPEMGHLGEGELDASGVGAPGSAGRSSKTSRQRRSAPEDDYDDYERERDRHYSRRSTKQNSADKSRSSGGGRRSYETNQGRSGGGRPDDSRRSRHSDLRNWDGYEEYRRKSSRNSDLEKERTNGGTAAGGSGGGSGNGSGSGKRRNRYDGGAMANAYDPYGMYEQMSRNPQAYAMYAKFYGQMIDSMREAVIGAAASKGAVPLGVGAMPGALVGQAVPVTAAQLAAGSVSGGSEAALLRERERYTHAYITQANEFHRRQQYKELIHQQQQQQQQQHQDILNSSLNEDNASFYGGSSSIYGQYPSYLSSARSLSNLNGDGRNSRCGPYYAGSECGLDIRAAAATPGEAALPTTTYGGVTTTSVVARPPRRRTPLMFNRPHLVASYAMSLLLKVKPKYAGRGRLRNDVEVAPLRIRDGTSSLLRMYPGPLQGRKLHKDKIISFCKEQIRLGPTRGCTVLYATQKKPQGSVNKYRASHALMWHLLILLLRQNGYIADTDVGDLLLENQQEYPYDPSEYEIETETDEQQQGGQAQAEAQAKNDSEEADSDTGVVDAGQEETQTTAAGASGTGTGANEGAASAGTGQSPLSEQAATDKFRSYVLRGNVEEALQWATDNNLWTHAFFLALYEDRYALTDVAQKFLNRAIKVNDPLQTLYQMKSCRTPACVSQLRDEQWGDWRSHLSILVTNKSRQPEYDRSSVVALGDTLFQRGDIYAAHFCYLVAQEEFGRYDSSATELTTLTANVPRLILLGASHYKPFNEFASNEAIIMTEIYEYARSLFDPKFSIAHFQHYKFLLATRILDYGQHFRCTNYLEQIARHIELKPDSYDSDFIQRVCGLAERLRYHDPILINRVSFASPPNANSKDSAAPEEKAWLRQLRSLADVVSLPHDDAASATLQQQPQQEQQQQVQEQQQQQQQLMQQQDEINQQFAEVNKQFRELNMQYHTDNAPPAESQPLQQQPDQQQPHQYYEPPPPQAQPETTEAYGQAQLQQQQQPPLYYDPNASAQQQQQQQQPYDQQPLLAANYGQVDAATEAHQAQAPAPEAPAYGFDYWGGTQQQPPYGDEPNENQASLTEEEDELQHLLATKQQQQQQHTRSNGSNRFKSNALKQEKISVGSSSSNSKKVIPGGVTAAAAAGTGPGVSAATAAATSTASIAAAAAAIAQIKPAAATSSTKAFNLNDLQQQQPPQGRPAISMPKSKSYDDEDDGGQKRGNGGSFDAASKQQAVSGKQSSGGDLGAPPGGNQNSGWFGGLWNKLSLKPKNQMILPDDKNPTIVWDKERKCWTNTEGNSDEAESFKPPPKMSELGAGPALNPPLFSNHQGEHQLVDQSQQQQLQQPPQQSQLMYGSPIDYTAAPAHPELIPTVPLPAPSPLPTATAAAPSSNPAAGAAATPGGPQPKLQSNMFKMQRNRTLKNSYVDVFNPSGAPMSATPENVLAPIMAPAAVPQGGYFVPGAAPGQQQ